MSWNPKFRIAELLYERDWGKQQILDLFAVIDWLMALPPELEKQLWTSISELERNMKMPYVTSVERLGIEKGRQEGREEGRQEEGVFFLRRLLVKKFGNLPASFETRLTEASIADLELWGDRILEAKTLTDIFD